MPNNSKQERMFAKAIYEIRLLLSGYLGSSSEGDIAVRQAAHLAYALHNQALQSLAGDAIDFEGTLGSIASVDNMLGSDFASRFAEAGIKNQA
jgi:hypothetical protein